MTWNSNKFRVGELLGKGCFGEVFAARDLSEDKPCAIKKISVTKLAQPSCSPRQAEHNRARAKDLLLSEVQTLIALNTNKRSDHIVGYFECGLEAEAGIDNLSNALKSAAINASVSSGESITNCQNDCFFYIKMELCHTNLKNWMDELPNQEDRIRKISTIRDIWRQVLVGLDFMHHRNVPIIHRDLKPDNVFINVYEGNVQVKIGDFGLSTQLLMNAFQKQSKVGSDRYASPEMLFRTGSYDTKTDIFSAGLIFYESLRVFQTEDDLIESFSNIKLEREGLLDSFSSGHNLDAELHLIRRMVSVKPENRPHARYLLQKAFKNQKGKVTAFDKNWDWPDPMEIFEIDSSSNGFIHMDTLESILHDKRIAGLPLVIISINGRERTGKSFMLSNFIKFLESLSQTGERDHHWIDQPAARTFKWIGGIKSVTTGIQLWSKPFIVKTDSDSDPNVAVLLMDTQGMFDSKTSVAQCAQIFSFSLFLSSIFIYNDKISGNDIFQLMRTFLESAKQCARHSNSAQLSVFQKLILLRRDWHSDQNDGRYYSCGHYDDNTVPVGQNPELNLKTFTFSPQTKSKEARKTMESILSTFEDVSMYAMAPPLTFPEPDKNSSEWSTEFRASVIDFVEKTLHKDNLSRYTKCIGNVRLTAESLLPFVSTWANAVIGNISYFSSSVWESMAPNFYDQLITSSLDKYVSQMNDKLSKYGSLANEAKLMEMNESLAAAIETDFRKESVDFVSKDMQQQGVDKLKLGMIEEFNWIKNRHLMHRKIQKIQTGRIPDEDYRSYIDNLIDRAQKHYNEKCVDLELSERKLQELDVNRETRFLKNVPGVNVVSTNYRALVPINAEKHEFPVVKSAFDAEKYYATVAAAKRDVEYRKRRVKEAKKEMKKAMLLGSTEQ